jgi:hypothetical protein
MLTYLIILVVIAVALAPLANMLPSKRQREIARMREYAAVHGLFVEFRDVPSTGGIPVAAGKVIYYGKRLPSSRSVTVESGTWFRTQDGWQSPNRRLAVPAPLQEFSLEIVAASVDQISCGVYWTELDGEAGVEQIRQLLDDWCGLLMQ